MSALQRFKASSRIETCRAGAAAAVILSLLAAGPTRADIISMAEIARGIVMTQAQCAAIPQAVWVGAMGRDFCMRYYLSTAGGEGPRPVVFLQGDLPFDRDQKTRTWLVPAGAKDGNTDDLVKYADRISKSQKTTGIYLARMGRDGSSGWHLQRHTLLELQATNAALEAIKQRHGFDGFHIYGHSGGGNLVGGLLTLRKDIGCAVPADGILAPPARPKPPDPSLQYFDSSADAATIAQNRSARILVLIDPQDMVVPIRWQLPFVEKLRQAGGSVEQFLVEATDDKHHFTTPHAELVMTDCLRGASHDEIAADLADLVAKRLAAKARAFDVAAAPQDPDRSACNNRQDHDASISGCTRIIDRGDPEPAAGRAVAYRNRADAYYRKGDADRAIIDADEAIRVDPKLASAYNTRGHAYLSRRDYDRAIQDYDEAIRLDPKFANFHVNRGSAYYGKGDTDRAIQDCDEAIRLDPKSTLGYRLRGSAYFGKRDFDRAIQDYDEAIRLDPNDARGYSGRGAAYREKGDLGRAMIELEASIRLNPNLGRAYFHRGLVFDRNGDRDRAIGDLRHALELEQNEAFAVEAREALAKIEAEHIGQNH